MQKCISKSTKTRLSTLKDKWYVFSRTIRIIVASTFLDQTKKTTYIASDDQVGVELSEFGDGQQHRRLRVVGGRPAAVFRQVGWNTEEQYRTEAVGDGRP